RRWPQYGDQSTLELLIEIRRLERTREFARPDLAFLKGGFCLEIGFNGLNRFCKDNYQALLSSMGLGDDQMVPYSACVMMELYNITNVIQLEIYYRHNGILDKLNLTECGSSFCTADQAIQLLEKRAIFGRQKLFEQCEKDGFCEIPVDNGEKDE
uniref:RING-type E3 ubiquitin transferase n=1 Tax=Globodera pallida TaxID=36090 RepID=A0A183CQ87_GLOPA